MRFPFQVAIACWIDLLGYGAMIAEAEFNPLHPKAARALARLRSFHQTVARHSVRYFRTLVINDGAVAYRDLSLRSHSPTYDFLVRAWNLFNDIKRSEEADGFPGARTVLASGFRLREQRAGVDPTGAQFASIMRRYQGRNIRASQAIREAAGILQPSTEVPPLQANFAFTKAYLAESSGSKGGLGGPNFFVDLAIFGEEVPRWVVKGDTIAWSNDRLKMQGAFIPILDLPRWQHRAGGPTGIKDGLQIAQDLAHDVDVLHALRAAVKP